MDVLVKVSSACHEKFIFIIDEWDAILREIPSETDTFVNLLRRLFKGSNTSQVFAAVYLTGILPIKKYQTQSALNNFTEYSVVEPMDMAPYFGFTKEEVKQLAAETGMSFEDLEKWYDGYQIGEETSVFNPNSVVMALRSHWCSSYWGRTAAYDGPAGYIRRNYDGLKDSIINMLSGGRAFVNITKFQNDMADVINRDDVLTVLIDLGDLGYDRRSHQC